MMMIIIIIITAILVSSQLFFVFFHAGEQVKVIRGRIWRIGMAINYFKATVMQFAH